MELQYSKGTLLLRGVDRSLQPKLPPGFVWDERVDSFRAAGYLYRRVQDHFITQNLNFYDTVPRIRHNSPLAEWKAVSLYPHQQAAATLWEAAGGRGIVVLPTGAGKTRVAMDLIQRTNSTTLVLVPTRVLLNQWKESLKEFYLGPVGILGDGEFQIENITISTFESAYRHIAKIGQDFDLLVVDEVHHFGVGLRDEILKMSVARKRLGLTASMPADQDHRSKIHGLIGPLVYEATVGDLKGTYLSDFDHIKLELALSKEEETIYRSNYERYRTFSDSTRCCWQDLGWHLFSVYASRTEAGRTAMESLKLARQCVGLCDAKIALLTKLLARHWHERIFIFVANTSDVCRIAMMFAAYPIVAHVKKKEREIVLRKFQEGTIRAIVACKVLNEGIDIPSASVAIILGGSGQPREQIQRIGRVLRKQADKRAVIYELLAKNTFEVRRSVQRNALLN